MRIDCLPCTAPPPPCPTSPPAARTALPRCRARGKVRGEVRSTLRGTVTGKVRGRVRGLSRYEFAVCCAIVGVLLAVLLSRLARWESDTRQLKLQTAMAAVNRALPVFQAHCLRAPPAAEPGCDRLLIDGQPIAGAHGHPAATADGIARLAGLPVDVRLRRGSRDGVPALTVDLAPGTSPPCEFTYVQAPRRGAAPAIDPHSISCPPLP